MTPSPSGPPQVSVDEQPSLRADLDAERVVRQAVCVILSDMYEAVMNALPGETQVSGAEGRSCNR